MDSPARRYTTSELVSTSSVKLKINGLGVVRIGPLSFITGDLSADLSSPRNIKNLGPMEHILMRGVYLVHRVKKPFYTANGQRRKKDAWFTVITLQDMDPRKVVDNLECYTTISIRALEDDLFFDNRRWMQLVGKGIPVINGDSYHVKLATHPDVSTITFKNQPIKHVLREQLAIMAYTCQLCSSKDMSTWNECVVTEDDMVRGDINTFFIRDMSKPLAGKLRMELSSPDMTEFCLTGNYRRSPSIVGVYHDDGEDEEGVCGHVMYTNTDLKGNTHRGELAFAIVLGSTFPTKKIATTRGAFSCYDRTTFGYSLPCSTMVYDTETVGAGDFTSSGKKERCDALTSSCDTKTSPCRKRKHSKIGRSNDNFVATGTEKRIRGRPKRPRAGEGRIAGPAEAGEDGVGDQADGCQLARMKETTGCVKSNRIIEKPEDITPCLPSGLPVDEVTAPSSSLSETDNIPLDISLWTANVFADVESGSKEEAYENLLNYIPLDFSFLTENIVGEVEIGSEEETCRAILREAKESNLPEELAEYILSQDENASSTTTEDSSNATTNFSVCSTSDSLCDDERSKADLRSWLSGDEFGLSNETFWLDQFLFL